MFCPNCGTENEEQYTYCKNCGTALNKNQETPEQPVSTSYNTHFNQQTTKTEPCYDNPDYNNTYNSTTGNTNNYNDYIQDISQEDMQLFLGKNADDVMPKFIKMTNSGSKICWCWAAAILGFVLGPIGLSIWFFHRKMYKPAWLLTIAATVYSVINSISSVNLENLSKYFSVIGDGDLDSLYPLLQEFLFSGFLGIISGAISAACAVLGGLFCYYLYKNHCIERIREIRNMHADAGFYKFALINIGGTSGGMLTLGIVLAVGIEIFSSFIVEIFKYFI